MKKNAIPFEEFTHVTAEGRVMLLSEMDDTHLDNTINYIKNYSRHFYASWGENFHIYFDYYKMEQSKRRYIKKKSKN